MQKKLGVMVIMVVALAFMAAPALAWVLVPHNGDTGWQTYTYTAGPAGFVGTVGFVVADTDGSAKSELLLDNLSQCGLPGNQGFEWGVNYGYSPLPFSWEVVGDSVETVTGTWYQPAEGRYMSRQYPIGCGTTMFLDAFGQSGYEGSILETSISLAPNQIFTFDWAFLSENYYDTPGDFSLFYLKDASGIIYQDGLAQGIATPIPSALLLLGAGLASMAINRRRKRYHLVKNT